MLKTLTFAALLLAATVGIAGADGTIHLATPAQFQADITAGNLTTPPDLTSPTDPYVAGLNAGFAGQNANFAPATLSTDTKGLVTDINGTNPTAIGCYGHKYGVDPNLSIHTLRMSFTANPSVDTVMIGLVDTNRKVKLWEFQGTPLITSNTFTLNATGGVGEGGSTFFFKDGTFDLTQVTNVEVAFRGAASGGHLITGTTLFSADIPEPSGAALGLLGVLTMSVPLLRRRARQKNPRLSS
jgi:hypothetical protein